MSKSRTASSILPLLALATACGGDSDAKTSIFTGEKAEQALADYKALVHANYEDVVASARTLDTAIDAFLASPSEGTQQAAKDAWIAARIPYGPSEVFRFYDGPIDDPETGPEGQINAWPLDENYIDYTRDEPSAGLVNATEAFPELTTEVIAAANEAEGDATISTGYHAIEFLLWGQDDKQPGQGAGKRPYTDYLTEGGTAQNQARRAEYLALVSDLLVQDVEQVEEAWEPGEDNFAATFGEGDDVEEARKDAFGKILRSLGSMAKAELSGERMTVAYKNRSQEDEHSCFSDNTAVDLLGNGLGIQNVWLGRYGELDGVGIDELVAEVDADLTEQTSADIEDAVAKLQALADLQNEGKPIDVVIAAADDSPERTAMLEAIRALKVVAEDIEKAASELGLSVQLEEASEDL